MNILEHKFSLLLSSGQKLANSSAKKLARQSLASAKLAWVSDHIFFAAHNPCSILAANLRRLTKQLTSDIVTFFNLPRDNTRFPVNWKTKKETSLEDFFSRFGTENVLSSVWKRILSKYLALLSYTSSSGCNWISSSPLRMDMMEEMAFSSISRQSSSSSSNLSRKGGRWG